MNRVLWFLMVLIFASCESKPQQIEVYSILHDITDPLLAQPDANTFLEAIDVSNTTKELSVRYRIISDIDFNPITDLNRPVQESGLFSNALNEKRKSESFVQKCKELLAEKDPIEGESHSSIFQPMVKELEYLSLLPNDYKKHLIVYSDLRENCEWFSYYNYSDLKNLERHPDKVAELFLKQAQGIEAIENLQIHVIFIPKNHKDNVEFKKMQNLYMQVFKELDIPISFSANLTKAHIKL